MAKETALCLNMIVKNEMANLGRCLEAVAPHISCWVIGDTGSSDGTQDFIRRFFDDRGVPGELHEFPFENFEQARNTALRLSYESPLPFDYILLDDADMELIVDDARFHGRLGAAGYQLMQRSAGGLSYWNTRLVRRGAGAWYHGVTHEYLDVPGGAEQLSGIWYRDHASGANRVDKFERDIRLLRAALEKDPDNARYWFYLAQSYQDAGQPQEAAEAYRKRAAMGGWAEEAWMARVRLARSLLKSGDETGFVATAMAAFNERPWRAEPLYDLARHYRLTGGHHAGALVAERGLEIPRPDGDILFIEDWVYAHGLREEFSITANYAREPERKARGFAACNSLALDRAIPEGPRNLAISNLDFYIRPASELMPSFAARRIAFEAPEGWSATNPSVVRQGDELWAVQRCVNYRFDTQYPNGDVRRYATAHGEPIATRNFLLRLGEDFAVLSSAEILPPAALPEPAWPYVHGFEDLRPFLWNGELWCVACVRELNAEGWCQQVLARIARSGDGGRRLSDWRVMRPEGAERHEKNWMPLATEDSLRFIYGCDPLQVVDGQARLVAEATPPIHAKEFRGGSQLVPFDDGWLALVHETLVRDGEREYKHRFVWFDAAIRLKRVSRPFYFNHYGVEFAAGLAWHPDGRRLVVSYGAEDSESWIATVEAEDVARALDEASDLPDGRRGVSAPSGARRKPPETAGAPHSPPPIASSCERTIDRYFELAPYLHALDSPAERMALSRPSDARIARFLDWSHAAALPQIHGFYEVIGEGGRHDALVASAASMRAAGHPVRIWSYSPEKLAFLRPYGVELGQAADVVPRGIFDKVLDRAEIRWFSDVFRYAVLYEHGGLWLDSDVVLLRPFPFRGDYFFNLQWRSSATGEHFVCGDAIYARPFSPHLRSLYEQAVTRTFDEGERQFGDVGPKLLSDYIASDAGAELRPWLFSPAFFNSIDWTEGADFERPIGELADFLNDERVFGVHLWTARHAPRADDNPSLAALLADPSKNATTLTELADRFDTDKNRHTGNRHAYARIYERLLASRRLSLKRLMEIGLCRGLAEGVQTQTPSVRLWQSYFPFAEVIGLDLTDFSALNDERFRSMVCDQSKPEDLRKAAAAFAPGSFDVIIDDGSHASFDQQLTLRELFPLLADGGWYFIEDLDWQPPGERPEAITLTKLLLQEIQRHGSPRSIDPLGIGALAGQFAEIHLFDSHYELDRAGLHGGLVAIRKQGGAGLVR